MRGRPPRLLTPKRVRVQHIDLGALGRSWDERLHRKRELGAEYALEVLGVRWRATRDALAADTGVDEAVLPARSEYERTVLAAAVRGARADQCRQRVSGENQSVKAAVLARVVFSRGLCRAGCEQPAHNQLGKNNRVHV